MARRVLADFDAELLLRLGNRTDITSTQRAFFLDDAYRRIANEFKHPELEATTTGTLAIAADTFTVSATDLWWPVLLKNTTGSYNLDVGGMELIENQSKPTGNYPRKYYWWGQSTFYVEQKPDTAQSMKLWYIKSVTELSAGGSPVIDRMFDPLLVMIAAKIGFETVRDFQEAVIQEVAANNYISEMKLPRYEANKADHNTGIRMRIRR